MDVNPRYTALRDMAAVFKSGVDPDNENLLLSESNLNLAVNEFYAQLDNWKGHLGCPDGIDHFKTAALTCHYLLKYRTFTPADPQCTTAIYRLSNIIFASEVAISRLVDGGRPVLIGKRMKSTLLGILLEHQNALVRHVGASPEAVHDLAHQFVKVLTQILMMVEEMHHDIGDLPV